MGGGAGRRRARPRQACCLPVPGGVARWLSRFGSPHGCHACARCARARQRRPARRHWRAPLVARRRSAGVAGWRRGGGTGACYSSGGRVKGRHTAPRRGAPARAPKSAHAPKRRSGAPQRRGVEGGRGEARSAAPSAAMTELTKEWLKKVRCGDRARGPRNASTEALAGAPQTEMALTSQCAPAVACRTPLADPRLPLTPHACSTARPKRCSRHPR